MTTVNGTINAGNYTAAYFYATFPSAIPAGRYIIDVNQEVAASNTDNTFGGVAHEIWWTGLEVESIRSDVYHADIHVFLNTSADEYTVVWFKNGLPATSITSPTLDVIDSSGSSLISSAIMSTTGFTDILIYDEPSSRINQSSNDSYIVTASATIGGETRTYSRIISNNSSNIIG